MSNIAIKKIDKLLLRTFIPTFVLLLALVLFIMVIQSFFLLFSNIAGKELGIAIYTKLLFYLSLSVFRDAFPIAILITSLIVFGNLSESFELTAMRSVGLSLQRTLRLPFIFILFLSGGLFYFQDYVHPNSKPKLFSLVEDICQKKSDLFIQQGVFCNNIPGYSIRVDKKLSDSEHMEGIIVYDYTKRHGKVFVTIAQKGRLYTLPNEGYLVMEFTNGHNYMEPLPAKSSEAKSNQELSFYRNSFSSQKLRINLDALKLGSTNAKFAYDPRTRTRPHLEKMIQERQQELLNQEKSSKALLAQETIRYNAIEAPSVELNGDTVEELASSAQEVAKEADFILFRDQLIERKSDSNTERHAQPYSHTLQRQVVRDALRNIRKIKNSLMAQKGDEDLLHKILNETLYEKKHRLAVTVRCVIMFLLAAPLGCMIRRGGFGVSVGISFLFILLEYILSILGKDFATEGSISTFMGAWLPNFILFPFCCFFLVKAQQGRGLSSTDWYVFYIKIKQIIKRKISTVSRV
ncbi:MAG: LptF/LptG family permease [Candidatus Cardinium sp.]|uniref:LptF/LptG family permease n=1 Tax=Cardinium endosymbiont of Dermatophagoides farinae TaxID=2597823 RepID=UPI0011822D16|nr:LptF/LptG family permease [Cardinium endosymbiont of Dermatophagoides farinae]TSJ81372.1 YjgP/YjgQ family permease [Cardinium endosymbiont of Dermatophagoides farinae]UWW97437.1 MAG: LptF/LptG family permease [Candidatus Cardinium sp.]